MRNHLSSAIGRLRRRLRRPGQRSCALRRLLQPLRSRSSLLAGRVRGYLPRRRPRLQRGLHRHPGKSVELRRLRRRLRSLAKRSRERRKRHVRHLVRRGRRALWRDVRAGHERREPLRRLRQCLRHSSSRQRRMSARTMLACAAMLGMQRAARPASTSTATRRTVVAVRTTAAPARFAAQATAKRRVPAVRSLAAGHALIPSSIQSTAAAVTRFAPPASTAERCATADAT
jgi:hypothetical protein